MADRNRPSFLRGLVGRIGDKIVWGNNYDRNTGQWNATPAQIAGGVGARFLNLLVPGVGTVANTLGKGYYGEGPAAGLFNHGAPGAPQMMPIHPDTSLTGIGDVGLMPGFVPSMPNTGGFTPGPATDWQGSLAGSNPFGGQYGGNLGFPMMPAVTARPIGGQINYGGGTVNNGVGAGTGYGAGSIQNDSWGNAALGFGLGTGFGSSGGYALNDAMAQQRTNRK